MYPYQKKLIELKELNNWNNSDLSRVLKCNRGTISRLVEGETRYPRTELELKINNLYRKYCKVDY